MSCWSAKSFVSCIARADEDQGFDILGILFVTVELHGVGVRKNAKKESNGIAQKMMAAQYFGDVPSIAAPSILGGIPQGNSGGR